MLVTAKMKIPNPIYRAAQNFFGWNPSFTRFERLVDENYASIRDFLNKYIQQRKSGQRKSDIKGNADLLSLFLQSPDIFGDEEIIDEMIDFFLAASGTTKNGIQTIIGHLATTPDSL